MAPVDKNQLRFNQALLVLGGGLALFCGPWPAYLLAALFALSFTPLDPLARLFRLLRVPEHPAKEDPRPHAFARALGTAFLTLGALFYALGLAPLGLGLTLAVALLAALNLTLGFCLGCFFYYQLRLFRYRLTGR